MALECKNCGIAIRWKPTLVDGNAYCCVGCSHGGPCTCDYEHLPSEAEELHIMRVHSRIRYSLVSWGVLKPQKSQG